MIVGQFSTGEHKGLGLHVEKDVEESRSVYAKNKRGSSIMGEGRVWQWMCNFGAKTGRSGKGC